MYFLALWKTSAIQTPFEFFHAIALVSCSRSLFRCHRIHWNKLLKAWGLSFLTKDSKKAFSKRERKVLMYKCISSLLRDSMLHESRKLKWILAKESFLSFGVISEKSNMCRCCSFHEFSKKITNNVLGVTYLCNMSAMQLY